MVYFLIAAYIAQVVQPIWIVLAGQLGNMGSSKEIKSRCYFCQGLFAVNKEKLINGTLAALLEKEGDQNTISNVELESQCQALRRLVASKAGFGAFTKLPK